METTPNSLYKIILSDSWIKIQFKIWCYVNLQNTHFEEAWFMIYKMGYLGNRVVKVPQNLLKNTHYVLIHENEIHISEWIHARYGPNTLSHHHIVFKLKILKKELQVPKVPRVFEVLLGAYA